ncbi:MAG: DUF998 domain-containing protein [Candidatus Bathyarchaeota archaeon]|nr:DUF998 domain-containing protein [Candidatus Bathyarchaeota archaeon]
MRKMPLSTLSALCLAVVFCSFLAVSTVYYPEPWSPVTTFLSDFGNISRSPFGALIYNMGCIMTAVAAVAFYIGLGDWEAGPLLGLGRMLGLASGVALALIGVFSEDFPPQHRFWSYAFFTINFFAMLLTNVSLMGKEGYGKPTMLVGFGISAVTLLSFILWGGAPAVEWFTVFASITFALLAGYDTYRKGQPKPN